MVVLAGIFIWRAKMRHEAASLGRLHACFLPDGVPLLLIQLQAGHHEGCKLFCMLVAFLCLALQSAQAGISCSAHSTCRCGASEAIT